MLQKILHSIVALVIFVSTTGFTVTRHYCGDNLMEVVVDGPADNCCDDDCPTCHDQTQHIQLKENFVTVASLNAVQMPDFQQILFELPDLSCFNISLPAKDRQQHFLSDLSPPLKIHTVLAQLQTYLI